MVQLPSDGQPWTNHNVARSRVMEENGSSCRPHVGRGWGQFPQKELEKQSRRKKGCWGDQTLSGLFPSWRTHSQSLVAGCLPFRHRGNPPQVVVLRWEWRCDVKYQSISDCHFRRSLFIFVFRFFSSQRCCGRCFCLSTSQTRNRALRLSSASGAELKSELGSPGSEIL